jgi:hypothetical protein
MITFKSPEDLSKLSPDNPAHAVIKELIDQLIRAYTWEGHPYIAEDYGYIVLIEPEDTDRILDEIWDDWNLLDIPWEGITLRDGFYTAIFLAMVNKLMSSTATPKATKTARKTTKKAPIRKKATASRRK